MKKKEQRQSLKVDELKVFYSRLQEKALDLWIVSKSLEGNFAGTVFWSEITAISQDRFSLLRNLPPISGLFLNQMQGPNTIIDYSGVLRSFENKAYIDCASADQFSPLKSKVLGKFKADQASPQDLLVEYSDLIALFKAMIFQEFEVLYQDATSKIAELDSLLNEMSGDEEYGQKLSSLLHDYSHLVSFYNDSLNIKNPFPAEKIVEKLVLHYADMQNIIDEIQQHKAFAVGLDFWGILFSQLRETFYPYLSTLSHEVYESWVATENDLMLISVRHQCNLSVADPVAPLREYLNEDAVEAVVDNFYVIAEELITAFYENRVGVTAISTLSSAIEGLQKICCADIVLSELTNPTHPQMLDENQGQEPRSKVRKTVVLNRDEADQQFIKYLSDFSNALLALVTRTLVNFDRDSNEVLQQHDLNFAKLRQNVLWVSLWSSRLRGYDALIASKSTEIQSSYQKFLNISDRFVKHFSNNIKQLATSRVLLQRELGSELKKFSEDFNRELVKGVAALQRLISPTWDEWDDQGVSVGSHLTVLEKVVSFQDRIDKLLRSINFTQELGGDVVGYPSVSTRLVEKLRSDYLGLSKLRDNVSEEFFKVSALWFEKVKLAASTSQETSLSEVANKFYLLALYPYQCAQVLRSLEFIEKLRPDLEVGALRSAIAQFPLVTCKEAIAKMEASKPLEDFRFRVLDRFHVVIKARTQWKSVFHLLVRYLVFKESSEREKLSQDCLLANETVAQVSADNQLVLDDASVIGDFLAALDKDAVIVKQFNSFKDMHQTGLDYHNAVANLQCLVDQPRKATDALGNAAEQVLIQYVKKIWLDLSSATTVYKSAITALQDTQLTDGKQLINECRTRLKGQCETSGQIVSEIKVAIGLDGNLRQSLSRGEPELAGLAYFALPLAIRHLEGLIDKMKTLGLKLEAESGNEDSKNPFSPC